MASSVQPSDKVRKVPRQQRAQESVQTILRAAADLIEESGYEAYNTNAVAERSGLSVALIYRYFPNKESILVALWDQIQVERHHYIIELIRRIPTVEDFDRFGRAIILVLRKVRSDQPGSTVIRKILPAVSQLATIGRESNEVYLYNLKAAFMERWPSMSEAQAGASAVTLLSVVAPLVDSTMDSPGYTTPTEIFLSNSRLLALFFKDLDSRFT
jgi:AcrR family transcriptional regulator